MGKEFEKEYIYICIYMCITESLCYTPETQHCKSTVLQLKKKKSYILMNTTLYFGGKHLFMKPSP